MGELKPAGASIIPYEAQDQVYLDIKSGRLDGTVADKVEVNGPNAHPLFEWLKEQAPGLLGSRAIKWNFTKFLVGKDGQVIRRYAPTDAPETLERDIEAALAA